MGIMMGSTIFFLFSDPGLFFPERQIDVLHLLHLLLLPKETPGQLVDGATDIDINLK